MKQMKNDIFEKKIDQNQNYYDLETWNAASRTQALQSSYKW